MYLNYLIIVLQKKLELELKIGVSKILKFREFAKSPKGDLGGFEIYRNASTAKRYESNPNPMIQPLQTSERYE